MRMMMRRRRLIFSWLTSRYPAALSSSVHCSYPGFFDKCCLVSLCAELFPSMNMFVTRYMYFPTIALNNSTFGSIGSSLLALCFAMIHNVPSVHLGAECVTSFPTCFSSYILLSPDTVMCEKLSGIKTPFSYYYKCFFVTTSRIKYFSRLLLWAIIDETLFIIGTLKNYRLDVNHFTSFNPSCERTLRRFQLISRLS